LNFTFSLTALSDELRFEVFNLRAENMNFSHGFWIFADGGFGSRLSRALKFIQAQTQFHHI